MRCIKIHPTTHCAKACGHSFHEETKMGANGMSPYKQKEVTRYKNNRIKINKLTIFWGNFQLFTLEIICRSYTIFWVILIYLS